ncbi:uncharacterized protein LOC133884199 [Phragmites australis]|uniref:uncharacterized protein LOC133884199 n=1 Tax=Phragmites australis TaxID=29695 RepID=UPI002D784CC3|nr:uncharacterized protein LOC133884199 [Phragmites australis]
MAQLLVPILLLLLVSHVPVDPLSTLLNEKDDAVSSPSSSQLAPAPSVRSSDNDDDKEEEKEQDEEKTTEGLVSFTNGTGSYKRMPRKFVNGHNMVKARYATACRR